MNQSLSVACHLVLNYSISFTCMGLVAGYMEYGVWPIVNVSVVGWGILSVFAVSFWSSHGRWWWAVFLFGQSFHSVWQVYEVYVGEGGWFSVFWSVLIWSGFFYLRHRRCWTVPGWVVFRVESYCFRRAWRLLTSKGMNCVSWVARCGVFYGQSLYCLSLVCSAVNGEQNYICVFWSVVVWVVSFFLYYSWGNSKLARQVRRVCFFFLFPPNNLVREMSQVCFVHQMFLLLVLVVSLVYVASWWEEGVWVGFKVFCLLVGLYGAWSTSFRRSKGCRWNACVLFVHTLFFALTIYKGVTGVVGWFSVFLFSLAWLVLAIWRHWGDDSSLGRKLERGYGFGCRLFSWSLTSGEIGRVNRYLLWALFLMLCYLVVMGLMWYMLTWILFFTPVGSAL